MQSAAALYARHDAYSFPKNKTPITHTLCVNRQARVVLEDRMKYSLQLTALRLNPRRLRGVQALT